MAITYHAGRRIQGLSTDGTSTTNGTASSGTAVVFDASSEVGSGSGINYSGNVISVDSGTNVAPNYADVAITATAKLKIPSSGNTSEFSTTMSALSNGGWTKMGLSSTQTNSTTANQADLCQFGFRIGDDGRAWYFDSTGTAHSGTQFTGGADTYKITVDSSGVVKFYKGSTLVHTSSNTASGDYYMMAIPYQYNGSATYTYTYSGDYVETTTGVKPTDVQVGSRFEETDTRNMYYYADTLVFTGDYSSTSGWTQATTNIANSGTGAQTVGIDGGWAYANSTGSANGQFVYTSLGTTISDTKWFADFEYYNIGAVNLYPFVLAAGTSSSWDSNQDMISVVEAGTNVLMIRYRDGTSQANSSASSTMSTNTSYFCRLIRDGQVLTLKMYTDSARTSQHGSDMTVTISGSVTGLTTLHHSGITGGGATSGYNFKVRGTKVYSGVTSAGNIWKELGT